MYLVYGMPKSRSTRVTWALEELGQEYRFQLVDLLTGQGQSPEFLKLNPAGKIPVLVDDELVLSESAAICTYLGDKHPDAGLVPRPGTAERARYDQWCHFAMSELEQPLWTIAKHKFALPQEKRVPQIIDVVLWEFEKVAALLAKGLGENEFLLGKQFTMVDILVAHTLAWAKGFKVPHGLDRLHDYQQRICARPAFARARRREQGEGTE